MQMGEEEQPTQPIPSPTPFVPDAPTFLALIGRNMIAHSSKIPSWDSLFSLSSEQLRSSGVEPARSRRYLLRWRQKFRNGEFGIGGDLKDVKDGAGELRIVEVKAPEREGVDLLRSKGTKRVVVNVAPGAEGDDVERVVREVEEGKRKPVEGVSIKSWNMIAGKNVRLLKGTGRAEIKVQEGLWEHRRGKKVDGGERRKAEVRAKRRAAERKDT
ncbi:IGR protein motif-domain-containing protein [Elsinoe ampelina]|uniref:Small ribosomal subunit protein mS41 n=1 Tax=Elsinoe ampelina TaxID=302913 RepID=A0A6A6G8U9_9PEZI|nr:IGR protein motif-domain-containing protein [Elsinoe ampelina]